MPENLDSNPDFIEARIQAGFNQYDLELIAAPPEITDFGQGGGELDGAVFSSLPSSRQNAPGVGTGTGGCGDTGEGIERPRQYGCPALDQYVLAMGKGNAVVPKPVKDLTTKDHLYNPLTKNFNKVTRALIVKDEDCLKIQTADFGQIIVSFTHPIIQSFDDKRGAEAERLFL